MYMCVHGIAIALSCDISVVSVKCCDSVWLFHCSFHLFCSSLCLLLSRFYEYALRVQNFTLYGCIYALFFPGTRYCCMFSHKTNSRQCMCGTWKVDTTLLHRKQQGPIIYSMHLSIKSIIPPPKKKIAPIIVTSSSSSYIRSC